MNEPIEPAVTSADAVVVGSGPNGLAAAVTLARAGLQVEVLEAENTVGGGSRTLDLGLAPGIVHDVCSAVHPMALASPFLRALDLEGRGVRLAVPELSYAQALDGTAGLAWRDLERTAEGLGADGRAWHAFFAPMVESVDEMLALSLGDKRSIPGKVLSPRGLATGAGFGARVAMQGTPAWGLPWRTERARALFSGVAAHAIGPLRSLANAGAAAMLGTLAHAGGWPVPIGGSQAIIDALVRDLEAHGGRIHAGVTVRERAELGGARAVLFDTAVDAAVTALGGRLSRREHRALGRMGHATAAAKVDFVLSGPVPWRDPQMGRAGTVHIGGTREQMAAAEQQVVRGRLPEEPVMLLSDPSILDPGREVGGLRPLWTYAHVPLDCPVDPTELVIRRIERFAPGFRDVVVAARGIPASRMHEHNPALIGGDISLGTVSMLRMIARPTFARDPYRLTDDGDYLCSAATPPGPGVHGLCGYYAAVSALADRFGISTPPSLAPRG